MNKFPRYHLGPAAKKFEKAGLRYIAIDGRSHPDEKARAEKRLIKTGETAVVPIRKAVGEALEGAAVDAKKMIMSALGFHIVEPSFDFHEGTLFELINHSLTSRIMARLRSLYLLAGVWRGDFESAKRLWRLYEEYQKVAALVYLLRGHMNEVELVAGAGIDAYRDQIRNMIMR